MSATTAEKKVSPLNSLEKAAAWLIALNQQINKEWGKFGHLTQTEWKQVLSLVQQYELPCEIGSTGFTWILKFYGHSPLPELRPDCVLQLRAEQVPIPGTEKDLTEQETALGNLAWLTHSKRNRELLKWYHLEPPEDPGYYMY